MGRKETAPVPLSGRVHAGSVGSELRNPQNRVEANSALIQALGARVENAYYAFGGHDFMAVSDLPDNVSAAAVSMAISAGGS